MAREVSAEEVRHMAALSRLLITGGEEMLFRRQFGDILGHVDILQGVDVENVEPLYSPSQHPGFTRLDHAANIRDRAEILANAPETDGESFMVPRII